MQVNSQLRNDSLLARFDTALRPFLSENSDVFYGVALSGGGDSMALLHLLLEFISAERLVALHFDHALRSESSDEAEWVFSCCRDLGVRCVAERWNDLPEGNLQQSARQARRTFFESQTSSLALQCVFVAHTKDDVAETFLMRLMRGSGVTGLAMMKEEQGVVCRPLLSFSREELRDFLVKRSVHWLDDPSNNSDKFLRVKVRKFLQSIDNKLIDSCKVFDSAVSIRRAEEALNVLAREKFHFYLHEISNDERVILSAEFFQEPEEIQLRLLKFSMELFSDDEHLPRTSKCLRALNELRAGNVKRSLGSCLLERSDECIIVFPLPEK